MIFIVPKNPKCICHYFNAVLSPDRLIPLWSEPIISGLKHHVRGKKTFKYHVVLSPLRPSNRPCWAGLFNSGNWINELPNPVKVPGLLSPGHTHTRLRLSGSIWPCWNWTVAREQVQLLRHGPKYAWGCDHRGENCFPNRFRRFVKYWDNARVHSFWLEERLTTRIHACTSTKLDHYRRFWLKSGHIHLTFTVRNWSRWKLQSPPMGGGAYFSFCITAGHNLEKREACRSKKVICMFLILCS